jgi:ribonuclease HI
MEVGNIHGAFQTLRPLYKERVRPASIPSLQRLQFEKQKLLQLPSPSQRIPPIHPHFDTTPVTIVPRTESEVQVKYFTDGSAKQRGSSWSGGYGICYTPVEETGYAGTDPASGIPYTKIHGRVPGECTSDRAELYAAAVALVDASQRNKTAIEINTDSAYLISMSNHFESILASGGDAVVNGDLLWFIAKKCVVDGISVTFNKVRAHAGVHLNEVADAEANTGRIHGSPLDEARRAAIFAERRAQVRLPVCDSTPSINEIASAVMKLSNLKAPGLDRVQAETIKTGAKLFANPKANMDEDDKADLRFFVDNSHSLNTAYCDNNNTMTFLFTK